jgi:hypothetical protein
MLLLDHCAGRSISALAELGLVLAQDEDIAEARRMAARLIAPGIAAAATLQAVQARTGCSVFVRRGEGGIEAAISVVPLTPLALPGLLAGVFDGVTPPMNAVAAEGQPVAALYGWGMAGETLRGRAAILAAALRLQQDVYREVPVYGRAATAGGERVLLKRLAAAPVGGPGGLVLAPAFARQRQAA